MPLATLHGVGVITRPVSESESERQRARNGASESERARFSRERATIHIRVTERVEASEI